MGKINLLLIGNVQLKNYFSNNFNVFFPEFNKKYYISETCKKNNIHVIFQVENLSKREIIYDINEQNCLKIFWAIDIHLNFYWQKEYFKNFDIIFTSQLNFVKKINQKIFWIPWGIPDEDLSPTFIPFSKRKHKISFVGLIDENRVKRKKIIEILSNYFDINLKGTTLKDRLNYSEMLKIYKNSCIVINESIYKDVNFRYFEATSQGALLYTEKLNNGEEILFKDKKEVLYYSQLNLTRRLKYFIKYPERLEKIAYNGWLKTKNFHKLSDRIKIIEKIILKNLKNCQKREKNIDYPLMFTYFRAIGEPFYKKDFLKFCKNNTLKTLFVKSFDKTKFKQIAEFLNLKDDILIKLNLVEDYKDAIEFINKNYSKIPLYHIGYLNCMANDVFLSLYELIVYLFKNYNEKAMKDRTVNYTGGKILFENENYQGAVSHFINLLREFPENIFFRKYAAVCFFKLYELELFYQEVLKIFLLERKFNDFRKIKIDRSIKKETIYEITTRIKDKKLIRDIIFNLSDFYESPDFHS